MPVWKLPVRLLSEEELRCPVTTTLKQSCPQIKTFLTGNNRKLVLRLRTLLWDISVGATITGKGGVPNVKRRDQEKLRLMNIGEFIDAIEEQQQDPQTITLPFEERFSN